MGMRNSGCKPECKRLPWPPLQSTIFCTRSGYREANSSETWTPILKINDMKKDWQKKRGGGLRVTQEQLDLLDIFGVYDLVQVFRYMFEFR